MNQRVEEGVEEEAGREGGGGEEEVEEGVEEEEGEEGVVEEEEGEKGLFVGWLLNVPATCE